MELVVSPPAGPAPGLPRGFLQFAVSRMRQVGLRAATIANYRHWIADYLRWLVAHGPPSLDPREDGERYLLELARRDTARDTGDSSRITRRDRLVARRAIAFLHDVILELPRAPESASRRRPPRIATWVRGPRT